MWKRRWGVLKKIQFATNTDWLKLRHNIPPRRTATPQEGNCTLTTCKLPPFIVAINQCTKMAASNSPFEGCPIGRGGILASIRSILRKSRHGTMSSRYILWKSRRGIGNRKFSHNILGNLLLMLPKVSSNAASEYIQFLQMLSKSIRT